MLAVNLEAWSPDGVICANLGAKAMHLFFDMLLNIIWQLSEGVVVSGMAKNVLVIKYFTFIPPHTSVSGSTFLKSVSSLIKFFFLYCIILLLTPFFYHTNSIS